ncbi:hypothetical protein V500_10371 [Pseudogymnoascus sp. VKM F-4518 (FW-2643)]|nr:hypothetical protein V500_10371 [Pseudogymnoascus sp. VKM F-4518 (FW-2643)]
MTTFHPFPRLPTELRIQIWGFVTEDRVLKVRKSWHRSQSYWSPTAVPAVTRACRESRDHCSYRKAYITDSSPRHIWVNFDCDVIQMNCGLLPEENLLGRGESRHLRVELGLDETEYFHYSYVHKLNVYQLGNFPKLQSFDLLVSDGLCPRWRSFIKKTDWGACPRGNVRIVDGKTGEWIDEETSGPYRDYIDANGRRNEHYTRLVYYGDGDEDEDEDRDEDGYYEENDEERMEALRRLQIPLPRIDLDY